MEKKKGIIITGITLLLLLVVGVTYAFFTYESGTKSDIVTGQIYMNYEETSTILLTGVFPETKAQALARTDENGVFEFTITGRNTSKYPVYYEIDLLEGGVMTGKTETSTKILPEHVRIYLERDGEVLVDGMTYADWNNRRIYVDTVPSNQTSNIEHNYTLRMWIDENVTISDTDPNADYTTSEWNGSYASLQVRVVGDFEYKETLPTLKEAVETNIPNSIQDADAEGNRYLTGSNPDNYVWYSGKLWRIVSINSDNTIKLVTQSNITSLAWNTVSWTAPGTNYATSQVRDWLNKEFLPVLENSDKLLENSTWDYTTYASGTTTKVEPVKFVEKEKVGLLTIYDYYKVRNGSSSNFLNISFSWWTMSPKVDATSVWYIDYMGGYPNATDVVNSYGVRPSIVLKSHIQLKKGDGTLTNPYVIDGDKDVGVDLELLSKRINGEYVDFNNVLYRIVATEIVEGQTLTKITMADYNLNKNTLTTSLAFGADASQRIYSPTYGIGLYLEEWYQADSTSETYATTYIKDNYKAMIATSGENGDGVVWYTGPTSGTGYDYTKSKTGTPISATIGLGYYGEIFTSQSGAKASSSSNAWLMTIYSNSHVWVSSYFGSIAHDYTTENYGVRPSFYLKSNVKITGGSGMPHDPYEITM